MRVKSNIETPSASAAGDMTLNEPASKATDASFEDDRFVELDNVPQFTLRASQHSVWWSELDIHIQALTEIKVEKQEPDEKLLKVLRNLGLSSKTSLENVRLL